MVIRRWNVPNGLELERLVVVEDEVVRDVGFVSRILVMMGERFRVITFLSCEVVSSDKLPFGTSRRSIITPKRMIFLTES